MARTKQAPKWLGSTRDRIPLKGKPVRMKAPKKEYDLRVRAVKKDSVVPKRPMDLIKEPPGETDGEA